MRNATGRSPFCRAHELVARDAARGIDQRGGFVETATEIVSDLLAGRGLDREKAARAVNEAAWELGGNYTRFIPDLEDVDFSPSTGGQAPRQRPQQRPGWFREEAPPEPPDVLEKRRQLAQARQVLGFGPSDVITLEALRARHRQLAKKHHPDRGGSLERMQTVNAAVDVIAASLA